MLLEGEYPELATNLTAALESLRVVDPPSPDRLGLAPVSRSQLSSPFACGSSGVELQIGLGGGLVSLKRGGRQWAGAGTSQKCL